MKFNALDLNTINAPVDMQWLVGKINTGKAILFTGAGFSRSNGCLNIDNESPSTAKELSAEICKLAGIDKSENLMFSSDYYISKGGSRSNLIDLLKRKYTIKCASKSHENIVSLPWRRFYTTNYDCSLEFSATRIGRYVETIDLSYNPGEFYKVDSICIHLNGSVNSLSEEKLNNAFKLSASSYISADSFTTSDWFYFFKRDLERASVIVFVGYSMYDIDIQKVLFNDESLIKKVFFITGENPDVELNFTLSKFGKIIPIGVDGFSDEIVRYQHENQTNFDKPYELQALKLYEASDISDCDIIRDADVERMLMYGDVEHTKIDTFMSGRSKVPFLVSRNIISDVKCFIEKKKHIVLYGMLGNGKSILLKELKCALTSLSYLVYEVDDVSADYICDIDELSKRNEDIVILLDDYEKYIDLIEHVARSNPDNIRIIASSRLSEHEYCRGELARCKFEYNEINVDTLDANEIEQFVSIIDNIGLWGEKAGYPVHEKIKYLQRDNEGQLSVILISLLDSPHIKTKIKEIVSQIKINRDFDSTLMAISLSQVLGIDFSKSIISDMAGNDAIYRSDFISNPGFKQLFRITDGKLFHSSSLFCIALIKNNYTATLITDKLLDIAERFNSIKSKDHDQKRVFKSMLKFSFIERILPTSAKIGNMQRYYEELKVAVPWLRNDPHFWLQYAMSYMAFENFPKAQQYIDEAYAIAKSKSGYHTDNIDTQQAKLFLLSAKKIQDGNIVYSNFEKAHGLLSSLKNDVYKLRQVVRYKCFYDENYRKLSKTNKINFLNACRNMLDTLKDDDDKHINVGIAQLDRTRSELRKIILQIAQPT